MKSLSLSQPYLLIMVGLPGSGKSHFADKFSATFQAPSVDYVAIMDIANQNGVVGGRYTLHLLQELFRTKQTIVYDGPADSRAQRLELRDIAADAGYKPLFIWVQTDETTAKTRFAKAHKQAGRRASATQYAQLAREFHPPIGEPETVVISGKHTFATQAKAVLKSLVATRQNTKARRPSTRPAPQGGKRNIAVR